MGVTSGFECVQMNHADDIALHDRFVSSWMALLKVVDGRCTLLGCDPLRTEVIWSSDDLDIMSPSFFYCSLFNYKLMKYYPDDPKPNPVTPLNLPFPSESELQNLPPMYSLETIPQSGIVDFVFRHK